MSLPDYMLEPPAPSPYLVLDVSIGIDKEMSGEQGDFFNEESVADYVKELLVEKFKQEVTVEFVEVVD